jgi:hypothetical protein
MLSVVHTLHLTEILKNTENNLRIISAVTFQIQAGSAAACVGSLWRFSLNELRYHGFEYNSRQTRDVLRVHSHRFTLRFVSVFSETRGSYAGEETRDFYPEDGDRICLRSFGKLPDNTTNQLRGFSPRANYTDRATAACRRSWCQLFGLRGVAWSVRRIPYDRNLGFLDRTSLDHSHEVLH